MSRRILLKIDSELYETLNAGAWARVWKMFPPDTQLKGSVDLNYVDDTYSLYLSSTEFDDIAVSGSTSEFDLEAQRPIGVGIEDAQFQIKAERYGDPEPKWVRTVPSIAQAPVSPAAVRALLNSRDPQLPGATKVSFDYGKLEAQVAHSMSLKGICLCDMAYTGRRQHRSECPCKK